MTENDNYEQERVVDPMLKQCMLEAYLKGFSHARGGETFQDITERTATQQFNQWFEMNFDAEVL
jgi:hypothetical protein